MPFDPNTAKPVGEIDVSVFDPDTAQAVKPSGVMRRAGDRGLALAKGVIGVPEAVVGVADLATGGQAGKLVESAGVRFKDAKGVLDEWKSPEQKAIDEKVQKAEGFFPTLGAMVQNPSSIVDAAIESAPSILAGGVASRGALAVAPKLGAVAAGALGEGVTAAGQNAEQVRQEDPNGTLTGQQSAILAGSGLLTGGISLASGKLANKLGIGDVQTMLAAGKTGAVGEQALAAGASKGFARKVGEGVAVEGALQELPQSYQEQVGQNLAQGKPWDEGASKAGAQGLLAGGLMGGIAGPLGGHSAPVVTQDAPGETPPVTPTPPSAPPQLGFNPGAGTATVFPDGSTILNSESANGEQAVFNKRFAPQPVDPVRAAVQQAADAGGSLSAAAGLAMDSGAYMPPAGQVAPVAPEPNPVVLQNRDRTSAASIAQMQDIASNPDYLRVGPSRDMTSGAPVVFGDLPPTALMGQPSTTVDGKGQRVNTQYAVVDAGDLLASHNADGTPVAEYANGVPGKLRSVAGNGRTAGLQAAYRMGAAGNYRQELIGDATTFGADPQAISAMQRPVLVRVMQSADVTPDMGDRTNITTTQKLSPLEQAGNDARRLDVRTLEFDEAGSPTLDSIKGFVSAQPVAERGDMLNTDGTPTRQAVDRLMAATFKSAYESDELVQLYAQATDPDARAVMAAAADASGVMANLKGAGEFDVRSAVADAAKLAINAARQGLKLSDVMKNADIDMNPEAFPIAAFLAENVRSPRKMAEGLRRWGQLALEQARIAEENTRQGGMFGPSPTLTRQEIFARLGSNENPTQQGVAPAQEAVPLSAQPTLAEAAPVAPRTDAAELAQAGRQWDGSTPSERQAIAARTDLKGVLKSNVKNREWASLNMQVQRQLADAMAANGNVTGTANVQDPAPRAQTEPQAQAAPAQTPENARSPGLSAATGAAEPTAGSAAVEAAGVARRHKLLQDMEGLKGTTRRANAQYQIDTLDSDIAEYAKIIADPSLITGMMPKSVRFYESEVANMRLRKADLEAVLPDAAERDRRDQSAHISRTMLSGAKQELDAAIKSGQLTPAQAQSEIEKARKTGNVADATESIFQAIDNESTNAPQTPQALPPKAKPEAAAAPVAGAAGEVAPAQQKALDRIAKGTAYFGTGIKAAQFIQQNGLKDTHEVAKVSASRFEVQAKKASQPVAPALTAPTKQDVLAQQERQDNAEALDAKAKIDRERDAADQQGSFLQSQAAPDQRSDNTGDMFGGPSLTEAQSAAYDKAKKGATDSGPGLFGAPDESARPVASSTTGPVANLYSGAINPANSEPMQEMDGFKAGEAVDVPSRTIGRSTVEFLYTNKMQGFPEPMGMARIKSATGKLLDVATSELSKVNEAPAQAAPDSQAYADDRAAMGVPADDLIGQLRTFGTIAPSQIERAEEELKNGDDTLAKNLIRINRHRASQGMNSKTAAPKEQDKTTTQAKDPTLDDELRDALGALGDVLGDVFGGKLNMMPAKHTAGDLLPALSKVVELLIRKGFRSFKDATSKAAQLMRADPRTAANIDAISARQWKAAYNAVADGHENTDSEESVFNTSADAVKSFTAPAAESKSVPDANGKTLSESLYQAITDGNMPKDNPALKKLVEAHDGKPATPARMKEGQELLEAAIVKVSRDLVNKKEFTRTTFDSLLRLYESQPNLNIRTSTSIANQAYSTPAPLAFLGSELADVTRATSLYEPTAGNGMLTIGANPKNVTVNEMEPGRIESLKALGLGRVLEGDALKANVAPKSQDRVMTNPPFGSVKDAAGKPTKIKVDGYDIGQIDHLIAARALETMKDDGKAVLIIGANKVAGGLNTDDRIFFNWLYGHYNVTGHFEVNGDLYTRQGAGWPVRVISIDGRARSNTFSPVAGTIQRADNWSQVYEHYQQILDSSGRPDNLTGARPVGSGGNQTGSGNLQQPAGPKTASTDRRVTPRGSIGTGNVAGAGPRAVPDSGKSAADPVGAGFDEQRLNAESVEPDRLESSGKPAKPAAARPADAAGATALAPVEGNQFQLPYTPRSARKDEGVLIPANMAQPIQDALSRLEDEVGDIDEFARKELGYKNVAELHGALMGLQVDSVAMAIHQIKKGKALVVSDQTGIGKGRQAAAIIRWAERQGHIPVFVSVKPSLFTDMYGDLADIGTHDINPFIMNGDAWVAGEGGAKLFANKPVFHKRVLEGIASSGTLPNGANALFMTYSQINVDNVQRRALMALAPNAVFILDESHNAAGASATGNFMVSALDGAKGVTYLSATYAKRPDNMPLYFKTDIGDAAADADGLNAAMASGGLPLQTVVSNNLVKAGQMFRRERSYDGVSIESKFDAPNRALHEKMSNEATLALRAIVAADGMFHGIFVKNMAKELAAQGASVKDNAGNQVSAGVQHTEFSSVVHNFVKQMLLGLKAQTAADEAIASLKRGEKPIIAVENTMGSFLNEYAAANGIAQGASLGAFDYRTVLSRALARTLVLTEKKATGEEVKKPIPLSMLDAETRAAYDQAQAVIDGLKLDIPVSPIDWMRSEITRAGFSVAEITGRNLAVDYTDAKKPLLTALDAAEQKDKVNTTRQFNAGKLDALVLNVAGSTGISLHASEKFEDQRQRHMIVAQAAGDINIFMQMLGRVHRTGQVKLPKYTILSVDLPTEKRPTAVLSVKMKSLNANTSSNTESATSVKSSDILNKYGDQIVAQYLNDNYGLAKALGLEQEIGGDPQEDIARKATGRLALQPIETQHSFYDEVEGQYTALIDYLNKTNQNDLEPRTFDFDAQETRQEVLFDGPNKNTPFGEDAIYGEYSIKAQGHPMKPTEIRSTMAEHLEGQTPTAYTQQMLADLDTKFQAFQAKLDDAGKEGAAAVRNIGRAFLSSHQIGMTYRVDINGEPFNAVVLNVRNSHKTTGNPYSLSKIQVTVAVNGALRSVSVPATQFGKIEVSSIGNQYTIEQLFKEQPANQRETAKIVTGNLLAAYGELQGVRGTIITFTKSDGTSEQGILLPKLFDYSKNTRGDYRLPTGADALKFLQNSDNKDIGRFGIMSRDGVVRVLPSGQGVRISVPKSKLQGAKYFLDKALIAAAGDFVSSGSSMVANVYEPAKATEALDILMKKQALYTLPSMSAEAKEMTDNAPPAFNRSTTAQSSTPAAYAHGSGAGASIGQVTQIVDDFLAQFAHKAPVIIADSAAEVLPGASNDDQIAGAVHRGRIHLFLDQIPNRTEAIKTLWHEMLHYGLRRFLTKDQFIAEMMSLYRSDMWVRGFANRWMRSSEGAAAIEFGGVDYARARGVDEALAKLAEQGQDGKSQNAFLTHAYTRVANWMANMAERFNAKEVAAFLRGITRTEAKAYVQSVFQRLKDDAPATSDDWSFTADAAFSRTSQAINAALNERKTKIVGETSRQYTPSQLAAMSNTGLRVEQPSIKERAQALYKDAGKKLAQGIVDQFAPVKDLDKEAYGLLRLSKGASGAFESFLKGGMLKLTDKVYDFDETKKGGVIDKLLTPLGGEHHDFMRWIAANRAEKLTGEGRENLFSASDIAALKTLADGQTSFDYVIQNGIRKGQTTRDRAAVYADSLTTFNAFNKNILDMAEQSGLIDGESRKVWESEFYVPFYRVADEADGGVRGMNVKGSIVRQEAFKTLKGGKDKLNADLLDNTLMNWAHLLDASAKNRAAKATLEAAERMGAAINAPEATVRQMGKSTGNKNGAVWFMDGGVKRHFLVDDPYLLTAISSLEYAGMRNPAMNAMSAFKHALTLGVTASPFFKVRNLIRDSLQVVATSPIGVNPLANVKQGWGLTKPGSDAYFRLLAGGGTIHFGTMMEGNESKRIQALVESGVKDSTILNNGHKVKAFYRKYAEPAITAYNELGNRGEAVNRAALYDQLIKQGVNHAEASLMARDLMDFSMQGSFTSVRFLTQVVPFMNARLQGSWKLGRAAKEDPKRFAATLGAVAAVSLLLLAAYGDDDDWKKRPDSDKNNFWWFKVAGQAFRIPKPFEIGAIATLAERGAEYMFDDEMTGKRLREQVLALLSDNLSMNPIPQMVKPMLEVYANKNSFTGAPIESMSQEKLKSEYRFNGNTSMTARAASTAVNAVAGVIGKEALSPVQIDHMLRGYFGWLGTFVVGAGDMLARPLTNQPERATSDLLKTLSGGMVANTQDAPSRYVNQMYEQAKVVEQAYGTWRALVKEGKTEEAAAFREENQSVIAKHHAVEHIKQAEAKMNNQIRIIERSNLDGDAKRAAIREIQARKNDAAKRLTPA